MAAIFKSAAASRQRLMTNFSRAFAGSTSSSSAEAAAKATRSFAFAGGALAAGYTTSVAFCGEKDPPHAPWYNWYFRSMCHSNDVASVRRGYEVYRQVCSTCHSMKNIKFRHLANHVLPELRMKEIAASYDVSDGPDDTGEMFERPGILTDSFPSPYPNDAAARYANGGALPPDLGWYAASKHEGPDYIMSLLLGYREPPEGLHCRPGMYYNTYFPGGLLSMPPPLAEDLLEYEDGTPATVSQLAKDVTQFLVFTAEPMFEERKVMGLKMISACAIGTMTLGVWYRSMWTAIKLRRFDFTKAVM